jgi:hypothetical protein
LHLIFNLLLFDTLITGGKSTIDFQVGKKRKGRSDFEHGNQKETLSIKSSTPKILEKGTVSQPQRPNINNQQQRRTNNTIQTTISSLFQTVTIKKKK